ncbi:MAG: hypothetical protein V4692_03485, partial [Bdellovibrionota bacterium]
TKPVAAYIKAALEMAKSKQFGFFEAVSEIDQASLENFLAKEFPGRWAREFAFWKNNADTARAKWSILKNEADEVVGFSRSAIRGRIMPLDSAWTPGALRFPLEPTRTSEVFTNDSCLGPIGIAASERGNGTGKVLLGLVLETLRLENADRVCIDWTNAFKYYEPLEFNIARRFWTAWKSSPI